MGLARSVLLAASRSVWLRERAVRYGFVRRAVTRFMPGETLDDALAAAGTLGERGIASTLTCLGENVGSEAEVVRVADHYIGALDRIRERGLDSEISLKLTHLGLDLGVDVALAHLERIAARAREHRTRVWIDMEDSSYVDRTLEIYRRVAGGGGTGVCLQSYLRRTPVDLESLIPLGPAIRLVKGAYREPPEVAFPRKGDVDGMFLRLAARMLSEEARRAGGWSVFGTHDPVLIRRIEEHAAATGVPKQAFEFALLYGIRRDEQDRLAREGRRVRVLISYGSYWFPWYMRRLAERPANLWFVAKNMIGG